VVRVAEPEAPRRSRSWKTARERKEDIVPYEVLVKQVPAQHVAAIRKHTSIATVGRDVQEGMAAIWSAIAPTGIPVSGPPFLLMYDELDQETGGVVEICVPVHEPFTGENGVYGREVDAATAATIVHRGPYDEVGPAYRTLTGWAREHGHEIAGPPREVYLTDPGQVPDPADYLTEIQLPIR
jgi:effector-binding domain-containing protein